MKLTKQEAFDLIDLEYKASVYAREKHKYQKYGKYDYSFHLQNVVMNLKLFGIQSYKSDDVNAYHTAMVAWLHDIIEDTDTTKEDLYSEGFPEEVVGAVDLVTKKEGLSYKDYLRTLSVNELAWKVKVADTYSNMTQSMIDSDDKRVRKYSSQLELLYKYKSWEV